MNNLFVNTCSAFDKVLTSFTGSDFMEFPMNNAKVDFDYYSRLVEIKEHLIDALRDLEVSEKEMYKVLVKEKIDIRNVKTYLYFRLDFINQELEKIVKKYKEIK